MSSVCRGHAEIKFTLQRMSDARKIGGVGGSYIARQNIVAISSAQESEIVNMIPALGHSLLNRRSTNLPKPKVIRKAGMKMNKKN